MSKDYNSKTVSTVKATNNTIENLCDAQNKIFQAEEEIFNNKGMDANESLKRLKEKYNL